jgi:HAD superfamily hydrolase (TIGR01450 family)
MDFSRFKTFIFDLDGTVWNWFKLFPRISEIIKLLVVSDKQRLYVSNNTMLSRKGLTKKLQNFGIEAKESEVINAGFVVAEYLKNKRRKVLAFGDGLKEDLKRAKVKLVNKASANYLVVGHDTKFNYEKLSLASEAIKNGAKFLACAKGRYFTFGNKIIPGTGVLVKAVEYTSGKRATLLGKPSDYMLQTINLFVASPAKQTVLFGDELSSDIAIGRKAGWFTVLVKTGVDKKIKGKIKPDLVLNSVADVKI